MPKPFKLKVRNAQPDMEFSDGKLFPRLSILNLVRKVKKKGLELEAITYSAQYEDIVMDVLTDENGEPKHIAIRKIGRKQSFPQSIGCSLNQ